MIKLVIFDASGTLLNDFSVTFKAVSKILLNFGKHMDDLTTFKENFRLPYWNYYIDKGIAANTAKSELPVLYSKFYLEMMGEVELFPEVEEVTQRLKDMSVRLAISSQTPKEALSEILERSGIRDRFEMVVGLGDYQDPKPSPESILMVLNRLG
ncbi:MAG: HAD family hydrolase, partial [Nitrososphaerales archaeon]